MASIDADAFLQFFDEKVKSVRASTQHRQLLTYAFSPADVSLTELKPCTENDVCRLIMQSPMKSCALHRRPNPDVSTNGGGRCSETVGFTVCDCLDQRFTA